MENQEQVAATPRKMLHLQVAGNFNQEDLTNLIQRFHDTWVEGGIIATPNNVVANVIQPNQELAGMILTPKMTATEIAAITVDVINGFDAGQGNDILAPFAELDEDAKVEILNRIQCVLRLGDLPPTDGDVTEKTRDTIFVATVRALGQRLTVPNLGNVISVTRIAQKEGDEDSEVKFHELVAGDLFKYGDSVFLAESNPYVNWIANPLPVITIDAKVNQAPEEVAPEEVKASATDETPVQSLDSNS